MRLQRELDNICPCNNCIATNLPWDQFGEFSQGRKESAALKINHILMDHSLYKEGQAKEFLHKLYGPYGKTLLAAMVARQDAVAVRVWNVMQEMKSWPE